MELKKAMKEVARMEGETPEQVQADAPGVLARAAEEDARAAQAPERLERHLAVTLTQLEQFQAELDFASSSPS